MFKYLYKILYKALYKIYDIFKWIADCEIYVFIIVHELFSFKIYLYFFGYPLIRKKYYCENYEHRLK